MNTQSSNGQDITPREQQIIERLEELAAQIASGEVATAVIIAELDDIVAELRLKGENKDLPSSSDR